MSNPFHLYQVLYNSFPNDRKTLAVPYEYNTTYNPNPLHILIDWSNIFVSYKEITKLSTPPNLSIIDVILTRGRNYSSKTIATSKLSNAKLLSKIKQLKYKLYSTTRTIDSETGKSYEHGVDEFISFKIIELAKTRPCGIISLATGDGQQSLLNSEVGFFSSVKYALNHGWIVELYSFGSTISNNWYKLEKDYPKQFGIFIIDELIEDMKWVE